MLNKEQIHNLKETIHLAEKRSGRAPHACRIVAVSKNFTAEHIRQAHAMGLRDFGENYVQEFIAKKNELSDLDLTWHFIGHLQSNKVRKIVGLCEWIHSIDRIQLAKDLNKYILGYRQKILIEVNMANEVSKTGIDLGSLPDLVDEINNFENLILCGLMFMPPINLKLDEQRRFFVKARELFEQYKKRVKDPEHWLELSMGTSADHIVAIEEGATMIRLGTFIFGERNYGSR